MQHLFSPYRKLRISYKEKNKFYIIAVREFPRKTRKTHMALQSVFSSVYLNCNYRQRVSETLCSWDEMPRHGVILCQWRW